MAESTQTREFGPQLGRARKDKFLRHGTKVRMRAQLLGDAERKDARWRLGKACRNIELKRAAEKKRKAREGAHVVGPHLFALAPCYHVVSESDVCGTGKALVLTTSERHPCHALAAFSRAAHEAVAVVLPMQVTDELKHGWIEEASMCAPGPVSRPLLRTIRTLGAGVALVALGAESCSLLCKIVQDQLVAENAGVVVLVQPDLSMMKQGALGALAQLGNVELILSKSVAQAGTSKLLAAFPKASLRICNDGAPNASGIDLAEVGMCLADAILVSMGCEPSSTRTKYEEQYTVDASTFAEAHHADGCNENDAQKNRQQRRDDEQLVAGDETEEEDEEEDEKEDEVEKEDRVEEKEGEGAGDGGAGEEEDGEEEDGNVDSYKKIKKREAAAAERAADAGDSVKRGGVGREAEQEGEEGGEGEEELEELGLYEIVMRPQGGGGRGGDTGTRMSVMMLAPDEIWGDDDDEEEEEEEEEEENEGELEEDGEFMIVGKMGEEGAARGRAGEVGTFDENSQGLTQNDEDEEDAIQGATVEASRLNVNEGEEHGGEVVGAAQSAVADGQHHNTTNGGGEKKGLPAGGRVVLKGGGFFVVGGDGGRESAQRRAQQAVELAEAGVRDGGGEAAGQKWQGNYSAGRDENPAQKKRAAENKATAQSRARARERMRGERIGR